MRSRSGSVRRRWAAMVLVVTAVSLVGAAPGGARTPDAVALVADQRTSTGGRF